MTAGNVLLSTAYFPPIQYIALVVNSKCALIEEHENYLKQSYRNRCIILSAGGPLVLSVPVLIGSFHKSPVRDIRIDYSKKWQNVHLRGIASSYRSAPYFEFYFDDIEKIVTSGHKYLLDLNWNTTVTVLNMVKSSVPVKATDEFTGAFSMNNDYRYIISPKPHRNIAAFDFLPYTQVFSDRFGFIPGLSIIDLIFNKGPEALEYLLKIQIIKVEK